MVLQEGNQIVYSHPLYMWTPRLDYVLVLEDLIEEYDIIKIDVNLYLLLATPDIS